MNGELMNKRMIFKAFFNKIKVLLSLASLFCVTACSDPSAFRNQATDLGDVQPTGEVAHVYDPDSEQVKKTEYVAAGSKDAFVEIQNSVVSHIDTELTKAIDDLSLTPVDPNGRKTKNQPSQLLVNLKLKNSFSKSTAPIEFNMPLTLKGQNLRAENISQKPANGQKAAPALRASATCLDLNCRRVDLRLQKESGTFNLKEKPTANEAGLLYSISYPKAEVLKPKQKPQEEDRSLMDIAERIEKGAEVRQDSFSVVGGVSRSKVKILPEAMNGDSYFEFETPVINTAEVAPQVAPGRGVNNKQENVRILGIDPETSDMMFELSAPQKTASNEVVGIRVTLTNATDAFDLGTTSSQLVDTVTSNSDKEHEVVVTARRNSRPGLFPTTAGEDLPLKQTKRIAFYGNDSFVQAKIRREPGIKAKIKNAIKYAPKVSAYIVRVFEALGLTPEFAYIMLIESQYLVDGQYNSLQITSANPRGSAFGPWQIVNITAKNIRNVSKEPFAFSAVTGFGKKRVAPAADDRGYLIQSTYMAASYLKYIINQSDFQDEPIMAVVGYNRGDGYAKNASKVFLRRFKNYSINFATVRKFNMADTSYAHEFLAYREVGQNPEKYGLPAVEQVEPARDIERLSRKNGPLPPNYFNARIKPL